MLDLTIGKMNKIFFSKICLPNNFIAGILVVIAIVTDPVIVMATDYCNPGLCYGYGKHIGCDNNLVCISSNGCRTLINVLHA